MREALLTAYDPKFGTGNPPAPLDTLTIRPLLRAIMPGTTSREHSIGPLRFTSWHCHHSSGSVSQKGTIGPVMPALFISRSIGPSSRKVRATIALTCSADE